MTRPNQDAASDAVVLEVLAKASPIGEVRMDTPLADLSLDSLGVVEAVFEIEDAIGREIDFDLRDLLADARGLTVADLAAKLRSAPGLGA